MNKLAGILCCALLLPATAHAQFFMGHKDGGREQRIQKIYDQLGLSDEQKKLLAENKAGHKAATQAVAQELKAVMENMGEEMKKKDLDMEKINVLRARMKELRERMAEERFNAVLEVRKILTQEQFVKFSELLKQQREEREQRQKE